MQITNSAVHAKWAVVFAQLHMGGRNEGIHGFLVRIRNEVRLILKPGSPQLMPDLTVLPCREAWPLNESSLSSALILVHDTAI